MRAKLAAAFVSGFLLAVVLLLGIGRLAARRMNCRIGDLTSTLDSQASKGLEELAGPWVHHAIECHVGNYLVDAPASGDSPDILISRGKPFFAVSKNTTALLDDTGKRVLYMWNRDKRWISYAGYDPSRQAWIDNTDFGADGSLDYRTTESAGRPMIRDFKIGDRWLEMVKRGEQYGVIVDGSFMSVPDARKQAGMPPAILR